MSLEGFLRPDAPLARLDFRAKLVWLLTLSVLATVWSDVRLLLGLTAFTLGLGLIGGVRGRVLAWLVRLSLPFGVFMIAAHGFFNPALRSEGVWPLPGGLMLARAGLVYGIGVTLRMMSLVLSVPALMLSSSLEALVAALGRWRVPYKGVFIFAATLRFVPLLLEDAQAMIEAQRLRGIAPERLPCLQRLRLYGGMVVPLILGALVKAQMLDWVLEARAFGLPQKRTYLHPVRLRGWDWAAMLSALVGLAAALIGYAVWGIGRF